MLPFAVIWMDLEGIMLSEVSQTKKKKILYDITYMWNLKSTMGNLKKKEETDSQIRKIN